MSILKELIARLEAQAVTIARMEGELADLARATDERSRRGAPATDADHDGQMAEAIRMMRAIANDPQINPLSQLSRICSVLTAITGQEWFPKTNDTSA